LIIFGLFVIGILVGTLSNLLGLGGGILLVPALTLIFHLPIRTAVGASLVGIIAASAGVAVTEQKDRKGDMRLALRLETATTAGAVMGSVIAGMVNEKLIEITFALVALFTAVYMIYKIRHPKHADIPINASKQDEGEIYPRQDYHPKHWLAGLGMAGVAGSLSGLLGVSGGFIKVPILYSIMDVPFGIATTTSSIMVGITAAASVFIYYARGDIHPLVAIPIALGVFTGALIGKILIPYARVAWLRSGLIGLLVLQSAQMLIKAIGS
jgi:uncharacterized membrane protein YfcA